MHLKITWNKFEPKIGDFIKNGTELLNQKNKVRDKDALDSISKEVNVWENAVKEFLIESTEISNDRNSLSYEFVASGQSNNFNVRVNPIFSDIREKLFRKLASKINYLVYKKSFLSVCDAFVDSTNPELLVRKSYTTEEIAELIVGKLYDLYGDNYYEIKDLLELNNIELKRRREEFQYGQFLEDAGYIEVSQYGDSVSARLNLNGKLYVESQRAKMTVNYSNIPNSEENIGEKLEEILKILEKHGLGHEILFEELEELKELYGKLTKKNWGEILKGKLWDLVLSQIISIDTAKVIFEKFTSGNLLLP